MGFTTVGALIQQIRIEKKITRKKLAYGICAKQVLCEIESDQNETDILMLDIFVQRLGKSPDKFEVLLKADAYRMVRLRDLIEEAMLRGKRDLAEKLLKTYPSRTRVDKMYRCRMEAGLSYHIDKNCIDAAESLEKAIAITLPDFAYDKMDQYMISTVELENLLALERMRMEEKYKRSDRMSVDLTEEKQHLEICMDYIGRHFEDEEEHAKICGKCAWLLGNIYSLEKRYTEAMRLCERGIEGLRSTTILYFMLPLLSLGTRVQDALGIVPERSKWTQYYEILVWIWDAYAKEWYPTDSILHNCYQREYHLDYEFIRAERKTRELTQQMLAEGVYQNTECLSRVETGKVSPNKRTFEKLMDKLGIEKGRYNGYVVTDSFEVMELKRSIDTCLMRRDYQKARCLVDELKNCLDMEIAENKRVVKFYEIITAKYLGEMSSESALDSLKSLSQDFLDFDKKLFSHIPMRNEVLLINNICVTLSEMGREQEAVELYRLTLQEIKSSKVRVKHRYRSYAILLNNYMHRYRAYPYPYEGLQNELLCGKAMGFPFCLNNVLHILQQGRLSKAERDEWSKAIYYMGDLFYFKEEKEVYGYFLKKQCYIELLD